MVEILIYAHAILGGLALIAGAIALGVQKGGFLHRKSGAVFHKCMLGSVVLSLITCCIPGHRSAFLAAIGFFTLYFLWMGVRVLSLRRKKPSTADFIAPTLLSIVAAFMLIGFPVLTGKFNIALGLFGIIATAFSIRDFRILSRPESIKSKWLPLHLSLMTSAYIASVTAFLAVNQWFNGIISWTAPSLLGAVYIYFWVGRVKAGRWARTPRR